MSRRGSATSREDATRVAGTLAHPAPRRLRAGSRWAAVFAVTVTALAAAPTTARASAPDAGAPDAGAPVACDSAALVAAIASANDTPSADAVTLTAGCTYQLTAVNNTDPTYGPNGLPVITGTVLLDGNGATITRAPAAPPFRLLMVEPGGHLALTDLTVSGGSTNPGSDAAPVADAGGAGQPGPAGNDGADGQPGGGILNAGNLTLTTVTVTGNSTGGGGAGSNGGAGSPGSPGTSDGTAGAGGTGGSGGAGGNGGAGGGVYTTGTLTVTTSSITDNTTGAGGSGGAGGAAAAGGNGKPDVDAWQHSNGGAGGEGGRGGNGGRGGGGAGVANDGGTVTVTQAAIGGNRTGAGGPGGSATAGADGGNGPSVSPGAAGAGGTGGTGGTGGAGGSGSGAFSSGSLTVARSTVANNVAGDGGAGGTAGAAGNPGLPGDSENGATGGAGGDGGDAGSGGDGGGVASTGTLTVTTTDIRQNVAGSGGDGDGQGVPGGAPGADGTEGGVGTPSSLANTNSIGGTGGAGGNGGDGGNGGRGGGGAVLDGDATVTSSSFAINLAGSVTTGGNGGNGGNGHDGLPGGVPGTVHGQGGNGGSGGNAGAVGVTSGGAIFNAATLTVGNSTFGDNDTPGFGVDGMPSGNGGNGGNGGSSGNPVTGTGVVGGAAGNGGNAGNAGNAGTISRGGGVDNTGTAALINVTFGAANHVADTAPSPFQPGQPGTPGGGAEEGPAGRAGQPASPLGSAGNSLSTGAALTATNILVASSGTGGTDCSGTILDGGGNYNADGTCRFATGSTDPQLQTWADAGGFTPTISPGENSPAIDGGVESACETPPISHVDQRGVGRPQNARCDSGAVELAAPTQLNPMTVTSTLNMAFGNCTITLCTLPDAIAAANQVDGPAGIWIQPTGTITIPDTTFAITNTISISGTHADQLTIQAPELFTVAQHGALTLSQVSLSTGDTRSPEGHLIHSAGTVDLDQVAVINSAPGAALLNNRGTMSITDSTVTDVSSTVIDNLTALTISGSTFDDNSLPAVGDDPQDPLIAQNGIASIANSTFTGNNSNGVLAGLGTTTLANDTFAGNMVGSQSETAQPAGDVQLEQNGRVTATNTVFHSSPQSCSGPITDGGNNLEGGRSCGLTTDSISDTDPLLQALADNGGHTATMLPQTGSPTLDAGSDATCAGPLVNGVDQRGTTRPQGTHCDIGAVEAPATTPEPPVSNPPTPPRPAPVPGAPAATPVPTTTTIVRTTTTTTSTSAPAGSTTAPDHSPSARPTVGPARVDATAQRSGLAHTGFDAVAGLLAAAAGILGGAALLAVGRRGRRRRHGSST